jgi:hypothetical protein
MVFALATLLCAAPHVVVVQRSATGVSASATTALLADVQARLEAVEPGSSLAPPCLRDQDCLLATAAGDGTAAAIGVTFAAGPRGVSVDLEARGHAGEALGTWTGSVPTTSRRLPADAAELFTQLASRLEEPQPSIASAAPPSGEGALAITVPAPRPAGPLFLSAGLVAVAGVGFSIAGLVLRGPLDAHFAMEPIALTRAEATQQVTTINALFTVSLALVLAAVGLAGGGLIAWLRD